MIELLPVIFAAALLYFVYKAESRGWERGHAAALNYHTEGLLRKQVTQLKAEYDLKDKEYHLAKAVADFNAIKNKELERQLAKLDIERRALPFYVPRRDEQMVDGEALLKDAADGPAYQDEVPGLGR